MSGNKLTHIDRYRKKWHMNIGVFIFGAVFIYLIITVLLYFTDPKVSIYEVRKGSILRDTAYTGFILREEEVIKAESSGYINYFTPEGNKVGSKTPVYTLSSEELHFKDTDADSMEALSADEQTALFLKTQSFSENFHEGQFNDVYSLKNDIENVLESKTSQSKRAQLDEMLKSAGNSLNIYNAADDGIIIYSVDGYENITVDDLTEDIILKNNYEVTNMTDNMQIQKGDPAYKLITKDKWTIAILLSDSRAKELAEKKAVTIRFVKDNETAKALFSIVKKGNCNIGLISLSASMIRYAQERYLDIELILGDQTGLKIPKSSVVKKEFYTVPEAYITQGGNSKEDGVLIDSGHGNAEFKQVDIYYHDLETGKVYLDPNAFDRKIVLIKPDSSDTYQLGETMNLQGVYNINKGYAVFKQIQILSESDEYYIVQEGNDYGLSNYDHIALDGSKVRENDVVF